jgi:Protein of unknown function (DUF3352)
MRRLLLLALALIALVAAGCGSSGGSSGSGGTDPASIAPRGAILYGSVVVRPTGNLKTSVEAAGKKVLAGREVGPAIQALLDKALGSGHLNYSADVRPWLGKHIGFFLSSFTGSPAGAAIIETTDGSKAKATVDKSAKASHETLTKKTYNGHDYTLDSDGTGKPVAYAILDGFLVVGTESGLHAAVDAVKGDALADTDAYKSATAKVAKNGLALFYVDTPHLIDAIGQASPQAAVALGQLRGLPQIQNLKPVAAAITVDPGAIRVEVPGHGNGHSASADAIAKLPADSWLAFAAPGAGKTIRAQLKTIANLSGGDVLKILERQLRAKTGLDLNRDLLDWIGSVSGYATGTSLLDLNAAIVISSTNPAASKRAVERLSALIVKKAKVPVAKIPGGVALHPPQSPAPISLAAVGDKVVIAYGKNGVNRALHPSGTLQGSAPYTAAQKALGGGRPSFLLYLPSILQLAQGLGAGKSSSFQQALPYLQAYSAIAFGSASEGGNRVGRLAIGLK